MPDIWQGSGIWEGWRLTTNHSSSSYGQPVIVNPQGKAFGPTDIIRLDDVRTVPEAAEEWHKVTEPTLKRHLAGGRFTANEARKAKGNWLITRQGMHRVLGNPPMIKTCLICGSQFTCSPSDKIVTCSPLCRRERARRAKLGKSQKWPDSARKKLSLKGQSENLKKGTQAAMDSPFAGSFETNKQALIWTIISPEGVKHEVRNLNLWIKQNTDILPGTPDQAHAGFMQIKHSIQGKTKRQVSQWKGWRLIDWRKPD